LASRKHAPDRMSIHANGDIVDGAANELDRNGEPFVTWRIV